MRRLETPLPWVVRLHVLLQIATALHYLHQLRAVFQRIFFNLTLLFSLEPAIVHLDVKPLNILMGKRSESSWIAKLSDFGLSVVRQSSHSLSFCVIFVAHTQLQKKTATVKTVTVEKRLGFRAMSAVSRSGVLPTFLPAKKEPVGAIRFLML